jgi:hypothetical protein
MCLISTRTQIELARSRSRRGRLLAILAAGAVVLVWAGWVFAQSVDFTGELAGAVTANDTEGNPVFASFRYVPELFASYPLSGSKSLDFEGSIDARSTTRFEAIDLSTTDADIDVYRLWTRFNTPQLELRLGLQKISFGAATLFRPLMWFDTMDPRDPLQITDGVWGGLARYYFVNNANIWFWALIGNDEPKGWELIPSVSDKPEIGGRIQVPVPRGEVGASYHHRTADLAGVEPAPPPGAVTGVPEDRVGVDAKLDLTVGLWVEGSLIHQDSDMVPASYQQFFTGGIDYTFGIGDGLTVLAEHFIVGSGKEAFNSSETANVTGLSMNYPWGLVDDIGVIVYYDHDSSDFNGFFDWRRTTDKWTFHAIAFANPETIAFPVSATRESLIAGNGFQFLVVFNH